MQVNTENRPVLLFDGYCNLCNGSVNFVLKHEQNDELLFSSLDSQFAKQTLVNFKAEKLPDSLVYCNKGEFFFMSDAALELSKHLKFPFNLGIIIWIFPKFIRDFGYKFIAKRRYKWFGKSDTCRIPTKEELNRFLS